VAKQEQQDFLATFKKVDVAAMANKPIHGKATAEQMKALEDTLRGKGDWSIKAPWELENCPSCKCPFPPACNSKKGGASGKSSSLSCQMFRCASLSLSLAWLHLSLCRARALTLSLSATYRRYGSRHSLARDTLNSLARDTL
jgi:hypothetical protein